MSVAIRTATRIRDQDDFGSTPGAGNDGYAVTWDNGAGEFVLASAAGGVTDHGALTGLADNDHTQYRQRITNWLLVDPAGKGDYTTITAALAAVTSPTSSNRWIVDVAPGSYNESVTVPAYTVLRSVVPLQAVITKAASAVVTLSGNEASLDGFYLYNVGLSGDLVGVSASNPYGYIRDCRIEYWLTSGSSKTVRGIWPQSAEGLNVERTSVWVRADNNAAHGISSHHTLGLLINNCKIDTTAYSGSGGAVNTSGGANAISLRNSTITRYGSGYALDGSAATINVERCLITAGSITGTVTWIDNVRYNDSNATFTGAATTQTPLIAKAIASQTAALFQAQDSSGNLLFGVEVDGDIRTSRSTANTNTPSGATARQLPLYDASGTLLGYIPVYGSAW